MDSNFITSIFGRAAFFSYAIECPEKFTSLYSVMNSIGPFFCRAVGSQTFNVYIDKVGVSSYFSKCHKHVKL